MVSDLLYMIGEATLLEVEGVKEVTYPQGEEQPRELVIEAADNKKYSLTLAEII
jgi:hypothetical protein